ncbi:MAG TPA: hypothetical protein VJX92_14660 [Methylomirabilota bacterium]|nr:hypothetical protein [Methylomirabilota bacterium]
MAIEITPEVRTDFQRRSAAIRNNETAYNRLHNENNLPEAAHVTGWDAVRVSVGRVEDLGPWLDLLGGEIHASEPFEGVELWTLHTRIPALPSWEPVLPVLVSVPVLDVQDVVCDIAEFVVKPAVAA